MAASCIPAGPKVMLGNVETMIAAAVLGAAPRLIDAGGPDRSRDMAWWRSAAADELERGVRSKAADGLYELDDFFSEMDGDEEGGRYLRAARTWLLARKTCDEDVFEMAAWFAALNLRKENLTTEQGDR